jgi:3-dehydroquinate synthase
MNLKMQNKVSVSLSDRSYEILIGENAIQNLPQFLAARKYSKIFIITDRNVADLHLDKLQELVPNAEKIILDAGEQTKSFAALEKTCEEILAKGIDRKSLIIAFGGGVIGDLSGFIASILLRGIDFIQVPTTLLSCVDSSVGGKTAVNSKSGKNLIGSFYQPKLVICDLNFLKTLDGREMKSGYAEVVKYGLITDMNFFEFLEKNYHKIFEHDAEIIAQIIKRSCEIKAEIVGRDEKESGERALLNFGHTFGHIFETETNYSNEVLHGEAVALGMVMAAKMSQEFGFISQDDFLRILSHFQHCDLTVSPRQVRENWNEENLTKHLFKDKKHEDKKLTFILLRKLGAASVEKDVELEKFKKVLREFL